MSTAGPQPPVDCSWSLAEGGKKATDSKDPETSAAPAASLVRTSPHHRAFKVGSPNTNSPLPITKVLALGSPSAASRSEQDYPRHQVRAATALPSHPAAGPSHEARGVHEDRFELEVPLKLSCRVVSQGGRTAATGAALLGPGVGKKLAAAFSLPSSCHVEGQQNRLFLELNRWLLQDQKSKIFQSLSLALMHELLTSVSGQARGA